MHTVKVSHARCIDEGEFAMLKNTPIMSVLFANRIRLNVPSGDQTYPLYERSVKDWINTNCSSFAYVMKRPGAMDIYFRSRAEAAGFKLFWHDKTWE